MVRNEHVTQTPYKALAEVTSPAPAHVGERDLGLGAVCAGVVCSEWLLAIRRVPIRLCLNRTWFKGARHHRS